MLLFEIFREGLQGWQEKEGAKSQVIKQVQLCKGGDFMFGLVAADLKSIQGPSVNIISLSLYTFEEFSENLGFKNIFKLLALTSLSLYFSRTGLVWF